MKRILLIFTLFGLIVYVQSQETPGDTTFYKAKNATYISGGGAGIYFSVIFERQIFLHDKYSAGVKGGVGTSFSAVLFPQEFNFPIGVFFLYGKRNNHLDISLNLSNYLLEQYDPQKDQNSRELKLLFIPSLSYRFQKPKGGFLARVGFSPIINFNSVTNSVSPWLDISVGWAF
jgi:hypothetical protein